MPSTLFVDDGTGELDTAQLVTEATPIVKLVALFGGLALVPMLLAFVALGNGFLGALFVVLAQFVLAVGAAVVLLYVVTRANQLSRRL